MWNNLPNVTQHGEAWLRTMASRLGQWTSLQAHHETVVSWSYSAGLGQLRGEGQTEIRICFLTFALPLLFSQRVNTWLAWAGELSSLNHWFSSSWAIPNSPKSAKPVIYLIWFYAMQQFIFEKFSLLDNGNSWESSIDFLTAGLSGLSQPCPLPTGVSIQIFILSLHSLKE